VAGALLTVRIPSPVAKSLAEVAAFTVKLVAPTGVDAFVLIVRVAVLLAFAAVKETGLGEKDALAPAGNALVTLRVAVNAPAAPGPEPRLTVIVYVR
jgi:hypothetical protein